MASIFADLLRIRALREERAERAWSDAKSALETAEQALEQASALLEQFTQRMPAAIEAEYAELEEKARRNKGIGLCHLQNFRAFETHMHARREGLRVVLVEKQNNLKQANDALQLAYEALKKAQRARLKIEQLQQQERARIVKEQERSEEKLLEEFQPRSIFAQLQ